MLRIIDKEHYAKMLVAAKENGSLKALMKNLRYLHEYGGLENPERFRISLGYDWAGLSVIFEQFNPKTNEYEFFMNGGLIHHESDNSWSVHT